MRENISIDELELSVRAYNGLKNAGIETLDQLLSIDPKDLLKKNNIGLKTIKEIKGLLDHEGYKWENYDIAMETKVEWLKYQNRYKEDSAAVIDRLVGRLDNIIKDLQNTKERMLKNKSELTWYDRYTPEQFIANFKRDTVRRHAFKRQLLVELAAYFFHGKGYDIQTIADGLHIRVWVAENYIEKHKRIMSRFPSPPGEKEE